MNDMGRIGVWTMLPGEADEVAQAASSIEALGYGAVWLPGGIGGDVLERCATALGATQSLVLATGILNIWRHEPGEVAHATARMNADSGGRFVLGLGVSHQALIRDEYQSPMAKMRSYLDELDAAGQVADDRVLAALGPRMLELARTRSAGAHPYFVPPEHTAFAREALGPDAFLGPEQAVVLERDPTVARELAREYCSIYFGLPNYTNNLRRLGYTDDDLAGRGSDRVVDAVVAWGDIAAVAARVRAHLDGGADHVCVQVVGRRGDALTEAWGNLASELG